MYSKSQRSKPHLSWAIHLYYNIKAPLIMTSTPTLQRSKLHSSQAHLHYNDQSSVQHEQYNLVACAPPKLLQLASLYHLIIVSNSITALLSCGIDHVHFLFQFLIDYHQNKSLACQINQILSWQPLLMGKCARFNFKVFFQRRLSVFCLCIVIPTGG